MPDPFFDTKCNPVTSNLKHISNYWSKTEETVAMHKMLVLPSAM